MRNYSKIATAIMGIGLFITPFNTEAQTTESVNKNMNDTIKVSAPEVLVCSYYAEGYQIYQCIKKDDKFIWDFKGPEATLYDYKRKKVGRHYAGPTWESTIGSKVGAKSTARIKSKEIGAVPWLLLDAVSHEGKGIFSDVNKIQRVDTTGGDPTIKAEASNEGQIIWVNYTATYHFYKKQ